MKTSLRILDYAIIGFKIFGLIIFIINYESVLNGLAKGISMHYMIPFICYSAIGIIRVWKYEKWGLPLILFEIICNIYFILTVSNDHAFYLILTTISLFIILHLFYQVSISKKVSGSLTSTTIAINNER